MADKKARLTPFRDERFPVILRGEQERSAPRDGFLAASAQTDPRLHRIAGRSGGRAAAFKEVIDELNGGFGDGAGVRFVALGWEDTLATTGRRAQGGINQDIDRSDIFVLALHRRWGQEAPDAKPYTSYTEEEFHRAMDRWGDRLAGDLPLLQGR
jgi:hypothetical protein